MISVSVGNLSGVFDLLERVQQERLIAAARREMSLGLETVKAEAQANCPRDTGALAESIGTRVMQAGDQVSGEVYASAPYALHVEMGTYCQRAQPFLYPAMAAHEAGIIARIASAVSTEVMKKRDTQRSRSDSRSAQLH